MESIDHSARRSARLEMTRYISCLISFFFSYFATLGKQRWLSVNQSFECAHLSNQCRQGELIKKALKGKMVCVIKSLSSCCGWEEWCQEQKVGGGRACCHLIPGLAHRPERPTRRLIVDQVPNIPFRTGFLTAADIWTYSWSWFTCS